jgi:hypothetical protein
LIDDIGEASLTGRLDYGANGEALPEERMGWIRDLDGVRLWVLEAGIKRWLLSRDAARRKCCGGFSSA